MRAEPNNLTVLLGSWQSCNQMPSLRCRAPLAPDVIHLLSDLSAELLRAKNASEYPDVAAFAFFIRASNLKALQRQYADLSGRALGRGVSFHIAPSNVPIMFAYTLVAGLLSGNSCIVRVSEKRFPQVDIVTDVLKDLLTRPEHQSVTPGIAILRYGHDENINEALSDICDVRVIWGGDRSIREIRKAPLPARAFELVFADRYSILLVNADMWSGLKDRKRLAEKFYADTYLFDQNACSSPRLVCWVGNDDNIQTARCEFWALVEETVSQREYKGEAVMAVSKYSSMCRLAIDGKTTAISTINDNRVMRCELDSVDLDLSLYDCSGGLFPEYRTLRLDDIIAIAGRKLQTVSYLGFDGEQLRTLFMEQGVTGVDRIVPVGMTGSFSLQWDGYDMIRQMSRMISIL